MLIPWYNPINPSFLIVFVSFYLNYPLIFILQLSIYTFAFKVSIGCTINFAIIDENTLETPVTNKNSLLITSY